MGVGLQVFGENGGLLLDASDQLCRYLGEIIIAGTGAGQFNIPVHQGKKPWFFIKEQAYFTQGMLMPEIILVVNTIIWKGRSTNTYHGVYGEWG